MTTKTYRGERTIDGLMVTVNGARLDEQFSVQVFDEKGFEWSYVGTAPRQLALALLVDHGLDATQALASVDRFVAQVIANLDNDWQLTSEEIDNALS